MQIEKALFYLVNKNCANPIFDILMPLVTFLGSEEFILLLAVVFLFLKKRERKVAGILLIAGLVIAYFATPVLKHWVARPRPFSVLPDVHVLAVGKKGFSFPSGHAIQAFMAAAILSKVFKRGAFFFLIAALVGFSRVYIGVHFVSDVIAGAVIGLSIGYGLVIAARPVFIFSDES